jgi:hypothetical protein
MMGVTYKFVIATLWGGSTQGNFRMTWAKHLILQTYQERVQRSTYSINLLCANEKLSSWTQRKAQGIVIDLLILTYLTCFSFKCIPNLMWHTSRSYMHIVSEVK